MPRVDNRGRCLSFPTFFRPWHSSVRANLLCRSPSFLRIPSPPSLLTGGGGKFMALNNATSQIVRTIRSLVLSLFPSRRRGRENDTRRGGVSLVYKRHVLYFLLPPSPHTGKGKKIRNKVRKIRTFCHDAFGEKAGGKGNKQRGGKSLAKNSFFLPLAAK